MGAEGGGAGCYVIGLRDGVRFRGRSQQVVADASKSRLEKRKPGERETM